MCPSADSSNATQSACKNNRNLKIFSRRFFSLSTTPIRSVNSRRRREVNDLYTSSDGAQVLSILPLLLFFFLFKSEKKNWILNLQKKYKKINNNNNYTDDDDDFWRRRRSEHFKLLRHTCSPSTPSNFRIDFRLLYIPIWLELTLIHFSNNTDL